MRHSSASVTVLVLLVCYVSLGFSSFVVLPLGTKGGIDESSLTSFAIASSKAPAAFVSCDAGTIYTGLTVSEEEGYLESILPDSVTPTEFLRDYIKAYVLSHAHLDHIAGLVINSVDDGAGKPIIGLSQTLLNLDQDVFNGKIWPNFGPSGLNKYSYLTVKPGETQDVVNTPLRVTVYPVYHAYPYLSTAFLFSDDEQFLLYFGDMGPDEVENQKVVPPDEQHKIREVWKQVAPLVLGKNMSAIFMESSYPDPVDDEKLFGHLTPKWVMAELKVLKEEIQAISPESEHPLQNLTVVITHIKPSITSEDPRSEIVEQLDTLNDEGIVFLYPEQGKAFDVYPGGHHFYDSSNLYPRNISTTIFIAVCAVLGLVIVTLLVILVVKFVRGGRERTSYQDLT